MPRLYFDIETAPRPEDELRPLMPEFTAPANYRDPGRIAEYLAEKQSDWLAKAALSATTGQVLAIGCRMLGKTFLFATGDEAADLSSFWDAAGEAGAGDVLVGFNILKFDLPFLIRRSWALEVPVPLHICLNGWISYPFCDLAEVWSIGDRNEFISLRRLAEFFGVAGREKDDGLTGRAAALRHLENDLLLTESVALRLLGPEEPLREEEDY